MNWRRNHCTIFFPLAMFIEIRAEAKRLDRSVSWILQRAWTIYRAKKVL